VPAADLTTGQVSQIAGENALSPNSDFPKWCVKLGLLGVLVQSSSNLYAQPIGDIAVPGIGLVPIGVGPQEQLPGRGATYSNLVTLGVQAGYFFAQNWSLELATGFPVWMTARISGFSGTAPVSGTELARILPSLAPMTIVYHFSQFGAAEPYLGAGIAPSFTLAAREGFSTGVSLNPAVSLIL
jgi:outer membrane protein W